MCTGASAASASAAASGSSNSTDVRPAIISASARTSRARILTSIALVSSRSRAPNASSVDATNARNARNVKRRTRTDARSSATASRRFVRLASLRHSRTIAGQRVRLARTNAPRAIKASRSRSATDSMACVRQSVNATCSISPGAMDDAGDGEYPRRAAKLRSRRTLLACMANAQTHSSAIRFARRHTTRRSHAARRLDVFERRRQSLNARRVRSAFAIDTFSATVSAYPRDHATCHRHAWKT